MSTINNTPMSLRQIMATVDKETGNMVELEVNVGQIAGTMSDQSVRGAEQLDSTLHHQAKAARSQATGAAVLSGLTGAVSAVAGVGTGASVAKGIETATAQGLGGLGGQLQQVSEQILEPAVDVASSGQKGDASRKNAHYQCEGSELQAAIGSLGGTAGETVDVLGQVTQSAGDLKSHMRQAVADLNEAATTPSGR